MKADKRKAKRQLLGLLHPKSTDQEIDQFLDALKDQLLPNGIVQSRRPK